MTHRYGTGQRRLQDTFDTRRLADRLAEVTADEIGEAHARFIAQRDMCFIATTDPDGWPEVSYKGGDPGFVRLLDARTLALPLFNGNGMFLTAGNLLADPKVAMLFIDWDRGARLRLNGEASTDPDDPLLATVPGAELIVRVHVSQVFANCRRYVHRQRLVARSPFVPTAEAEPPVPDWKLDPWFEGTLPAADPALDPAHPVAPAYPNF